MLVGHQRLAVDRPLPGRRCDRTGWIASRRDAARHADDSPRVLDDEPHDLEQRVPLEDRVRVDAAHVPIANDVQPGVPAVCLSAVLLVDDDQIRMDATSIEGPHGLAAEARRVKTSYGSRANCLRRCSSVPSVEPSLITINSCSG